MPPLPKKKHSSKRKGGRNAHNALKKISLSLCPQCQIPRMPHRACRECGSYNGREVVPSGQEIE